MRKFEFPSRLPLRRRLRLAFNHWRTFREGYPYPWEDEKVGFRGVRKFFFGTLPRPGLVRILWDEFWGWVADAQRPTFTITPGCEAGPPRGEGVCGERSNQWDRTEAALDKLMAEHMAGPCSNGKHICPTSSKSDETT